MRADRMLPPSEDAGHRRALGITLGHSYLIAVILLALVAQTRALAADLNSPIMNRPTIASEIRRGSEAALDCIIPSVGDPLASAKCISTAAIKNSQKMATGSEYFTLGINYGGWLWADDSAL